MSSVGADSDNGHPESETHVDSKENLSKVPGSGHLVSPPSQGGLSPSLAAPPRIKQQRPPVGAGVTPMVGAVTGSKSLTSLANLSPTQKTMLTGTLVFPLYVVISFNLRIFQ